ncbi:hypothetical protein [Flavobacterium sp. FlaQc-28]|uniref:hypothetical protein n=1 Tax=Flavobacterium sp. FlaQc-28 TaxID=3374178 RepID=UPI003757AB57
MNSIIENNQFNEARVISIPHKKSQNGDQLSHHIDLPYYVTADFKDIENDIKKYKIFMSDNRIYIRRKKDKDEDESYYFQEISNFEIKILQHIQDEKFPIKLLKVKNVFNLEKIFDIPSDLFNTLGSFENCIARQGNFLFTGNALDFKMLKSYLFDKMGNGHKIDSLGYQVGFKFWLWNNKVNLLNGESLAIDENGIFTYNNRSFYVPSANKIYFNNMSAFLPQKKMIAIESDVSISSYLQMMMEVHKDYSITAILFTISSIFQDIIVNEIGNFPILFLYGPGSSGKDQLADCCQSFFGIPQSAINLEGGASTLKGQIRKFAQFTNIICHLSEYKRGDTKLDGTIKGFWDRRGYEFGTIETKVSTDTVPILSSTLLTGNEYPESEALISRLLWLEFQSKAFTLEETKNYDILKDYTKKGVSHFTDTLLMHRSLVETTFKSKFRQCKENFIPKFDVKHTRVISNLAVLGSIYDIFKDLIVFPFTYNEMIKHFEKCTENQTRKLNSSSISTKFWDCFLASMRGIKDDRIVVFRDLRLDGNNLCFQFTSCYNKIQRQWMQQYRETAPNKAALQDYIKKDPCYLKEVSSIKYEKGKNARNTSGYLIDISKLQIQDEIINAIEWQICEQLAQ